MRVGQYYASQVTTETALAFARSLENHIALVQEACIKLGVPYEQYSIHDESKYSMEEFGAYAQNFHGNKSPVDAARIGDNFAKAWLHHIHHNPHHWQHWLFADGWTPKNSTVVNGAIAMPSMYALEMVADWMGASMAYTGSWDMMSWLWENIPRIRLHPDTANFVRGVLGGLGYADVVGMPFAGEK